MPVRNDNLGNCRTPTTKAASVRKQLGTKNSKSIERENKRRMATVSKTRMTDYRRQRHSYVRRAGGDEGGQG